jgi:hypothetical protein
MIKIFYNSIFLIFYIFICNAEPVYENRAVKVALNYISSISDRRDFSFAKISKEYRSGCFIYIVQFLPRGFAVVSGDDRTFPVLYYSTESIYDNSNIPPGFNALLDSYAEQINFSIKSNYMAPEKVIKAWVLFERSDILLKKSTSAKMVAPLVHTQWNQGYPYNKFCPMVTSGGSGGRAYPGCAAVAMAQFLKYYEKPDYGKGSVSYNITGTGLISVDFENTNYDWTNIVNTLLNIKDSNQINETARLIYHTGVSIFTDYNGLSSGSSFTMVYEALSKYFLYSPGLFITKNNNINDGKGYNENEWINLLKGELDKGDIVLYRAISMNGDEGHVFLIDGYNSDDYLHINWGWGGTYDGYYLSTSLTPGKFNYSLKNEIIIQKIPISEKISLQFPANNSLFFHLSDKLIWNYPSGNNKTKYRLHVARDSFFIDKILDTIVNGDCFFKGLHADFDTKYYWRIGLWVDSNLVRWRTALSYFTTAGADNYNVICIAPGDGARNISVFPILMWNFAGDSSRIEKIRIQIAKDILFSHQVFQTDTSGTNSIKAGNLERNTRYYWRAGTIIKNYGEIFWSEIQSFFTEQNDISISVNYPNPFNKSTNIIFHWKEKAGLSVKIFNLLGEEIEAFNYDVSALIENFAWSPKNLPSGVYYCKIKFNDVEKIIKMTYLK